MKVLWTRLALRRADEAAAYIASDSPGAAGTWLSGLQTSVRRLEDFPESGRTVADLAREDIRELLYGNYRVIYRVETHSVTVLTIRHVRRGLDLGELGGR